MKIENKFNFRGIWFPVDFIKSAMQEAVNYSQAIFVQDEEHLQDLVDDLIKGDPNISSKFIVSLNEYKG